MNRHAIGWMACAAMVLVSGAAHGDGNPLASSAPFAGKFSDGKLTVELAPAGDGYAGTITLGGKQYPAKANLIGDRLSGMFTASGKEFAFAATVAGDQMTLASGDMTYTLAKAQATEAGNPLAGGNGQPAAAAPAAAAGDAGGKATALGDFTVLGSTENGKTLFIKLNGATSIAAAVEGTADALAKVLDGRPAVRGGFADAQTKNRGGAVFTGKFKGAEVRGWIFCGLDGKGGGTATVVCAGVDADGKEIQKLYGFMPVEIKLVEHDFPDGSGSIGLPDGWTTQQQSATFGFGIRGPAGQTVVIQSPVMVNTPDGMLVRQEWQTYQIRMQTYRMQMNAYRQNVAARRQWPNIVALTEPQEPAKPDPERDMPQLIFCPYCQGAEEVLKTLYPIMEAKQKSKGGAYTTLEKVLEVVDVPGNQYIPGAKAGIAYLAVTDHDGDKETHVRAINRFDTYGVGDGKDTWVVMVNGMRAPEETFERDLPVMNAIMNSLKLNMDVVNKQIADNGAAIRKMGDDNERALLARGAEFNRQQDENFNRFEAQQAAQQKAVHDSASDFIEYIGGVRKVVDTDTGQAGTVDLFHSSNTVQDMNQLVNDPGRFVEIPLRNER